jgi:GNAT superfamily N-acetyltransferase
VDTQALTKRLETNELAAYRSIYQAPSADVAKQLGLGCVDYDGTLLVWNRAAPTFLFNRVLALGVFQPATDELLDSILARSQQESARCDIQLTPGAQPDDLASRLTARGLRPSTPWLAHYRLVSDSPPIPAVLPGYRIDRVTPVTAAAWADALLAGWGIPAWAAAGGLAVTLPIAASADWMCYAVVHEATGTTVGGGQLFFADGIARLYGDGVRPEHQRHGIQAALIAERLAEAQRRGCDLACSLTLPDHSAQRNMQRAGFKIAYTRPNYTMPKKMI